MERAQGKDWPPSKSDRMRTTFAFPFEVAMFFAGPAGAAREGWKFAASIPFDFFLAAACSLIVSA